MAVSASEVESVLRFLRTNGLADSESALIADMAENCRDADLGCSDYEKFLFPMVPPPPPVRIPATTRRSEEVSAAGEGCSGSSSVVSSEDEFVSLGSSTSDICSSEFTNPYGIKSTSPGNSKSWSDEMSQFDTARDYHDFDMQNDLFWYNEKDGGNFMSPSFEGPDFFSCPSEDKFIMNLDVHKQSNNNPLDPNDNPNNFPSEISIDYLDTTRDFSIVLVNDEGEAPLSDFYHFDGRNKLEEGVEGAKEFYGEDFEEDNYLSMKRASLENFNVKLVGDISQARWKEIDKSIGYKAEKNSNNCRSDSFKVAEKDSTLNGSYGFESGNWDANEEEIDEPPNKDDVSENEISAYASRGDGEYQVFDLRIVHRKNRTGFEVSKDLPIVLNTVIAGRYYVTEYIGSAAFSKVVQAHDLHTRVDVCLKIIKNDKDFFDQSLDEIKLLKLVNKHDPADKRHILRLYDFFYHHEHLFIVCELLRANLYEFQKFNQESGGEAYFTLRRLQIVTRQCLEALEFLHDLGIIHCDLKPENILIKSYSRCEIKVIDLGSSCFLSDNLCLYVQSRSYRAPEVILGLPYDQKIDMWSLGCILAELCSGEVLFPNEGVVTILSRMIGMFGPIDLDMLERGQESSKYFTEEFNLYHVNEETDQMEVIIPEETCLEGHLGVSDIGFIDFVRSLLEVNPQNRPTAKEALQHPWLSHIYLSDS